MEQDNENRQPEQPVEHDLFNLTNEDPRQPAAVEQPAEPAPQSLGEPAFKVNQEDHPVHAINQNPAVSGSACDPAAAGKEKTPISLQAGAEATMGKLLMEARTAAGHSIETVSQETHIRHDFIEALEADQADVLPNYVFLRAYVRALIEFYHLEKTSAARIEEQMEKFQPAQDVPEKLVEDIERGGQISETETRRIKTALIYGGIILLLLISLVVTSVIAVNARNKRIQAQKIRQEDQKFDTAQLEPLVPPQLPQPQVLSVPAGSKQQTNAR